MVDRERLAMVEVKSEERKGGGEEVGVGQTCVVHVKRVSMISWRRVG